MACVLLLEPRLVRVAHKRVTSDEKCYVTNHLFSSQQDLMVL